MRTLASKLISASSKKLRHKRNVPAGIAVVHRIITCVKYRPPRNAVKKRKTPKWQKKITDFFEKVPKKNREDNNPTSTVNAESVSGDEGEDTE